ncbi:MAG: phosphatase PAP2 family protein [Bacteroidetes bacterium]|nr:phosphatase PAP2 family protein [Bacteroidota bacterium]
MFEPLQHIDEALLRKIHLTWANSFLDEVLPFFRNPYFWAPVYLFLLVYMLMNHGKKGLWWCTFFVITFVFCDYISASIIKPLIHRIRPCNFNELSFTIRPLVICGSGYSFPSSHATNHFGMAMFMITTLFTTSKYILPLALFWASLICYSQLYVCVHYPSDIIAGATLGSVIGYLFGRYFRLRFGELKG